MAEHRRAARQKSFLQGRIYFNNRRSSVDCVIRDISPTGARLTFSSGVETPALVELHVPNKEETHSAKVAWRRGDEMGLEFVTAGPQVAEAELSARLQRLEEDVREVRSALAELRAELKRLKL